MVQTFIKEAPETALQGISIAVFDTRSMSRLVRFLSYAAEKIANALTKKGGNLLVEPEGFFVVSTKGPLKEGELERAVSWAKEIVDGMK